VIIALVGRPNTGKTTLFNALTGLRQRVANFPGCTVEKASGSMEHQGVDHEVIDLPGTFSLAAQTPDEAVSFDFLSQADPGVLKVLCVLEASNLRGDLPLALSLAACGYPVGLIVNMVDEAALNGVSIDAPRLASETGLPVALISARARQGLERVREIAASLSTSETPLNLSTAPRRALRDIEEREARRAQEICSRAVRRGSGLLETVRRSIDWDRKLFHPVLGPLVLSAIMILVFHSLFTWATPLMDLIEAGFGSLSDFLRARVPNALLASLLCDGVLAGLSAVAVFVPQIAILFTLIGFLEQSGYLPRAGAMVDRALRPFGLDGKVFIPFLSSFACAIPGVMAARTIPNEKRRLVAVLLTPLMTCSARLPVYTLLIAAFFAPEARPWIMTGLYAFGIVAALLLALALRATPLADDSPSSVTVLPPYRFPRLPELAHYVWTRVSHFLLRAGKVIFVLSLALWALGSFPRAPEGSSPAQQVEISVLGRAGRAVEPLFAPLGFDWRISIGVFSSFAAREVFVGTMGTLFALEGRDGELAQALRKEYGAPTGVALLIFFAVALQCVSTIAIVRRETGGWKWPALQFAAYFILAYGLAWAGYRLSSRFAASTISPVADLPIEFVSS
jgi:ferrous iron transport protein B